MTLLGQFQQFRGMLSKERGGTHFRQVALLALVSLYMWLIPMATTHVLLALFGAACYAVTLVVAEQSGLRDIAAAKRKQDIAAAKRNQDWCDPAGKDQPVAVAAPRRAAAPPPRLQRPPAPEAPALAGSKPSPPAPQAAVAPRPDPAASRAAKPASRTAGPERGTPPAASGSKVALSAGLAAVRRISRDAATADGSHAPPAAATPPARRELAKQAPAAAPVAEAAPEPKPAPRPEATALEPQAPPAVAMSSLTAAGFKVVETKALKRKKASGKKKEAASTEGATDSAPAPLAEEASRSSSETAVEQQPMEPPTESAATPDASPVAVAYEDSDEPLAAPAVEVPPEIPAPPAPGLEDPEPPPGLQQPVAATLPGGPGVAARGHHFQPRSMAPAYVPLPQCRLETSQAPKQSAHLMPPMFVRPLAEQEEEGKQCERPLLEDAPKKCPGVYYYDPDASGAPVVPAQPLTLPRLELRKAPAPPPMTSQERFFELLSREDTCWVWLKKGYCPRGRACCWMHPPLPHYR